MAITGLNFGDRIDGGVLVWIQNPPETGVCINNATNLITHFVLISISDLNDKLNFFTVVSLSLRVFFFFCSR